jgi:hypothetical protein
MNDKENMNVWVPEKLPFWQRFKVYWDFENLANRLYSYHLGMGMGRLVIYVVQKNIRRGLV